VRVLVPTERVDEAKRVLAEGRSLPDEAEFDDLHPKDAKETGGDS
jgi:hypothetical protein